MATNNDKKVKKGYRANGAKLSKSNKPRLTKKMKKLVHAFIETESPTQAGLIAYDTTNKDTARQITYDTLRKPHVQSYYQTVLDSLISNEELASLHVRNAKQTENYPTSQKAIETLERLKGLDNETEKQDVTVNILNVFNDNKAN